MIVPPPPELLWMFGAILAALLVGSILRYLSLRGADEELRRKRFASLRTWWIVSLVVGICVLLGKPGVCVLLAVAGIAAIREYSVLLGVRDEEAPAVHAICILAVIHYLFIYSGNVTAFRVFLPLGGLAVLGVVQLVRGRSEGYIRTTGGLFWGMMVLVFGMSHAAYLFLLPEAAGGPAGAAGWFLFLVVLTEADDIFQAIIGRAFGAHKRHRIAPVISPNKTWEGLIGGMLVTIVLAALLAPWLTNFSSTGGPWALPDAFRWLAGPAIAAILITVAGFFGDINMSAVKRDSGVKDSSKMLPGMGGLNDRVDSITFTAPVFAWFLTWWMT